MKEYEEALDATSGPTRSLLQDMLIPTQKKHIAAPDLIVNRGRAA